MSKIKSYPKVVIVGRTNVGKSTLFNRLAGKPRSIVLDAQGVTRDYLKETISWKDKTFDLIDTGGLDLKKSINATNDPILNKVREQALDLLKRSSIILFICDVKNGLTDQDIQIAKVLHQSKKPIFLLLNKSDNKNAYEENYPDFYSLNISEIIPISAIHGTGISDLLNKIVETLKNVSEQPEVEKESYKVVILGKPNVGKSCLMNLLIKKERSIVSPIAGTTRESISDYTICSEDLVKITDTAGIRRKRGVSENLESLMVKSSLRAVRQSDIVLLLVDVSELKLSDQELKLLFYAFEENKSLILIFNKIDLFKENDKQILEHDLELYQFFLKKIPTLYTSCLTEKNITKIYQQIDNAWKRRIQKFSSTEINELVLSHWKEKPMKHKTIDIKIFKIRQVEGRIPTFVLHVNHPEWFKKTQLNFIENLLRKNYDLLGCPIKFIVKKV